MFESFLHGLQLVASWPAIGVVFIGVVIGVWVGAVPGIGGIAAMVILLPFTFDMDPVVAIALLLSVSAVGATGDTITAVLLGVPGSVGAQATVMDGYPLAQKGQADRALGAAYTVSAMGGVFGGIILALSLPVIRPVILAFGAPEFFMLGVLGLTLVGSLSGKSILKGLAAACIGLLFCTVGYGDTVALPRYWMGMEFLLDGMPLVPFVMGLFAVPEIIELAVRHTSISQVPRDQTGGGGMKQGVKEAFIHWWLVLRSSAIGIYIGILPGVGGSIVDWVAYGAAVQSSKDKSQFGKGDIRGVIAPEAANNADRGGAMIPTIAFGIPGGTSSAILLGAMLIHGIHPGQEMLTTQLDVTFSIVWTLILANVLASVLLIFLTRYIARLVFIPGHQIVAATTVLVLMGAWMTDADLGDWFVLLGATILGMWLRRAGWPRPPVILGFVLGPIMEANFHLSTRTYGFDWLQRPIVLILIAITLLAAGNMVYRQIQARKSEFQQQEGEGVGSDYILSLPFTALALVMFAAAYLGAQDWPGSVRFFPQMVSIVAVPMLLLTVYNDYVGWKHTVATAGGFRPALAASVEKGALDGVVKFLLWLAVTMGLSLVIGQIPALALFPLVYLRFWAGYSWRYSLIYAAVVLAVLVGLYDWFLNVLWYPAILPEWLNMKF